MARRAAPAIETAEKPAKAPAAAKKTPAPKAEKAPREPKPPKASATEKATAERVDTGKGTTVNGDPRLRGVGFGGKNMLAAQIEKVLRQHAAGKLKVEGPLTVSKIATAVQTNTGNAPSTGAVTAALTRWSNEGYVKLSTKPTAFKEFASKYKDSNLDTFLKDRQAARAKDRAKAKAAAEKS